jgi:hypothetical protein
MAVLLVFNTHRVTLALWIFKEHLEIILGVIKLFHVFACEILSNVSFPVFEVPDVLLEYYLAFSSVS